MPRPIRRPHRPLTAALVAPLLLTATPVGALQHASQPSVGGQASTELARVAPPERSELEELVERYAADRAALSRRYELPSARQRERIRAYLEEWRGRLDDLDFDALSVEGRIDYHLLRNRVRHEDRRLAIESDLHDEMAPLLPFAPDLVALHERRRNLEPLDPEGAAGVLDRARRSIRDAHREMEEAVAASSDPDDPRTDPVVARRAFLHLEEVADALEGWFHFYDDYDPHFGWWTRTPYRRLAEALDGYIDFLREEVVGIRPGEEEPIVGEPLGREALVVELEAELVPHTPEEILEIAWEELHWGEAEMQRAAAELGFDDPHDAVEHVKGLHVEPGEQRNLVVEMAREAEEFLEERDLVTVPPLAREIWRMEMLSPEWQRTAPFFLGGEVVRVAFPTESMTHEEKVMSLRANNEHFSRAVVHHELIPGHHLQGFMTQRYQAHRSAFSTPFWGEGWALYWEMLLWDLDFPRSPEDEVGMLFWRNHRAARIIFSLSYHLGEMTPEEAIDFLVERVGHERASATAEVRRSFSGDYSPLYQMAYMWGGLQLRQLHRDLVESGAMSDREFHDHILRSGRMPIETVRASVTGTLLPRDWEPHWRFEEANR